MVDILFGWVVADLLTQPLGTGGHPHAILIRWCLEEAASAACLSRPVSQSRPVGGSQLGSGSVCGSGRCLESRPSYWWCFWWLLWCACVPRVSTTVNADDNHLYQYGHCILPGHIVSISRTKARGGYTYPLVTLGRSLLGLLHSRPCRLTLAR